ncbi:MAG: hypothetical protein HQ564_10300 [Candidatus Saganbacteria bacterium]|nr:hypothetical protein [Candidatus Saganbacteria bacterium]
MGECKQVSSNFYSHKECEKYKQVKPKQDKKTKRFAEKSFKIIGSKSFIRSSTPTTEYVNHLLKTYYPNAMAWSVEVSEEKAGLKLDDWKGCGIKKGVAIDFNQDGKADTFIYDRSLIDITSISAEQISPHFKPANRRKFDRTKCEKPIIKAKPVPFPFKGRLWPDTYGKITGMMMVARKSTAPIIKQMIKLRPDIKYQILYPAKEEMPTASWDSEKLYLSRNGRFLPHTLAEFLYDKSRANIHFSSYKRRQSDWGGNPYVWIRDHYYVGYNQFRETTVAHRHIDALKQFGQPLVDHLGAKPFHTHAWIGGGEIVSSSKHVFVKKDYSDQFDPQDTFSQMYASGLKPVKIDKNKYPWFLDLDVVLTPTEEVRNGKPVVFVADTYKESKYIRGGWALQKAADHTAKKLRDKFHVERLPFIIPSCGWGCDTAYSYNNVLLERYKKDDGKLVRKVYMPWYSGYDKANKIAAKQYGKYGYEVIPIKKLEDLAEHGGSLRGITMVTERKLEFPKFVKLLAEKPSKPNKTNCEKTVDILPR